MRLRISANTHILFYMFAILLFGEGLFGQTVLEPGDVAVMGVNANNAGCGGSAGEDLISIVFFKDLEPNTFFIATDNGWEREIAGFWGDQEGTVRITWQGATTIPKGTIITFKFETGGSYNVVSPAAYTNWSFDATLNDDRWLNLNWNGDQLYVFGDGVWDNNGGFGGNDATFAGPILYGFNTKTIWCDGATTPACNSSQNSGLHPDVEPCYYMNPTNDTTNFILYTGPTSSASQLEWINRIKDPSNWSPFIDCATYNAANTLTFIDILDSDMSLACVICDGCGTLDDDLIFTLPGFGGPFDVVYTDGTSDFMESGISDGHSVSVNGIITTTTFSLVSVTDINGCPVYSNFEDSATIVIHPLDTPTFNITTIYCQGDLPDILPPISDNAITGSWSPPAIITSILGSTHYVFTPDQSECADTIGIDVLVNPVDTPQFTIDTTYCVGDTPDNLPATSNNGISGSWNPMTINTTSANVTTYTFNPTGIGCYIPYSMEVTVSTNTVPTFGIENEYCVGDIPDPLASMSNNGVPGSWDPSTIVTSVAGVTTYTFTPDPSVCADPFALIVTVTENAIPTFAIEDEYCVGETSDPLLPISGNGITGTWSPLAISTSAAGTTTYTFTPSSTVCADPYELVVTVIANTTPTFNIDNDYCVDDPPDPLPTNSNNGIPGSWSPATINTSAAGMTTYTFTPSSSVCAVPYDLLVTVTANTIPTFTIEDEYCVGDTPDGLPTTSDNGIPGSWNPSTINTSAAGTTTYTFTPSPSVCAEPYDLLVIVTANTIPAFTLEDEYCVGDTPDGLPTTSDNGVPGSWNPSAISTSAAGTTTYTFTPSPSVCAEPYDLVVTVTANTIPTFTIVDEYCIGDTPDPLPGTSNNSVSGTWSPATISTVSAGISNYIFTPDPGGCNETFTLVVEVMDCGCADPATLTIDPVTNICEDEISFLNATLGGSASSITWSTDGDGTFNDPNITDPTYTPGAGDIATGFVTLTATTDDPDGSGPCTPFSGSVVLGIDMEVIPTFDNPGPLCQNDPPTVLSALSLEGIEGSWSPAVIYPSTGNDVTSVFTPDQDECAEEIMMTVVIEPAVIPSFNIQDTFCIDDNPPGLPTISINGISGVWIPGSISTAAAGTTEYIFTPISGCANELVLSVTIEDCGCADPAMVSINPIATICEDETISCSSVISGSASSVTWTTSGDGLFDNPVSTTPIYTPGLIDVSNGTVTLTVTTNDPDGTGPCMPATAWITVSIDTLVTPSFNIPASVCQTDPIIILTNTSDEGITGTWIPVSIDPSGGVDVSATFTPDSDQCSSPVTILVVVETSLVPQFVIDTLYCIGDVPEILPVISANGITGTWSPATISTSMPGYSNYIFTPDSNCGENYTLNVTVEDCNCADPAIVSINSIDPICEDEQINLISVLAGSATSVTWISAGDGTFDNTSISSPIYSPGPIDIINGSVILSVTTNDPDGSGPCVAATSSITLFIEELQIPVFLQPGPFCQSDPINIFPTISTDGISGSWVPTQINPSSGMGVSAIFTPDSGQCSETLSFDIEVLVTTYGSLTYSGCEGDGYQILFNGVVYNEANPIGLDTIPNIAGCDSIVDVNLVFNNALDASFTFSDFCTGGTNGPQNIVTPGGTFSFAESSSATASIDPSSGSITGSEVLDQFMVQYVVGVGACADTHIVEVLVTESFLLNCDVTNYVSSSGASDGSINLEIMGGTGPFISELSGPVSQTDNFPTSGVNVINSLPEGEYLVQVTDANGCSSACTTTIFSEGCIWTPIVTITSESCANGMDGSVLLEFPGASLPVNIDWEDDVFDDLDFVDDLSSGNYAITITDQNYCIHYLDVFVPLLDLGENFMFSTVDPTCYGRSDGQIIVETSDESLLPFIMNLSNGDSYLIDTSIHTTHGFGASTYEVEFDFENGCYYYTDIEIFDPSRPTLNLGNDVEITFGDSVQLSAETDLSVHDIIWDPQQFLSCINCLDPFASPNLSTLYTLVVKDSLGCEARDDIFITVGEGEFYFPNAFSPNGDLINDVFYPLSRSSSVNIKRLMIFNRWGDLIYEIRNILPNNPKNGWDGTSKGETMNPGVYIYLMEVEFENGNVKTFSGDITLMK